MFKISKKTTVRGALLWAALALVAPTACSSDKVEPLFPCTERLEEPYGICAHITHRAVDWNVRDRDLAACNDLGINYVRSDFYLAHIMPDTLRPMSLAFIDSVMVSARRANIKILPILGYNTPQIQYSWNHLNLWNEYVDTLLNRYPDIRSWEVWNEENLKNNWPPEVNADQYSLLLTDTYRRIHRAQPDSRVLLGGLAGASTHFITASEQLDSARNFDILNFHIYPAPQLPEEKLPWAFDKYAARDRLWGKHVWMTETGYTTAGKNGVSERLQAQYLPRTFIIAFAYGVDKVFWYNLRAREVRADYSEDNYGILHADLTPKTAYYAYQTLTRMLPSGSTRPELTIDGGKYEATWTRPNGTAVTAIWTTAGVAPYYGDLTGAVCYDANGSEVTGRPLAATPSITYIVH